MGVDEEGRGGLGCGEKGMASHPSPRLEVEGRGQGYIFIVLIFRGFFLKGSMGMARLQEGKCVKCSLLSSPPTLQTRLEEETEGAGLVVWNQESKEGGGWWGKGVWRDRRKGREGIR